MVRLLALPFALIVLLVAASGAHAASTSVVISQVQVQGAISGDPRGDAFVELHNLSDEPVSLASWLLLYTPEDGSSDASMIPFDAGNVIPPGGYYLLATPAYDGAVAADDTIFPPMDPNGGTVWLARFGFTPHDAISWACEEGCDYLLETSTLTGGQVIALGKRIAGVMGTASL